MMRPGALLVGTLLLLSACGLNMEKHYNRIRGKLTAHRYDDANAYVDSVKQDFYGEKNRLLYYMDKGMVLYLAKRYQESNTFLEKAKTTAQELWTESIGANAAAWLTTDNALPYQGEDFEKVLIHFIEALNYIGLNDYEAARVEARQVTHKLELYNAKYEEDPAQNIYKDDGFARWLSGKLAETEGTFEGLNDAWIDYKKALEVYKNDYVSRYQTPVPRFLVEDALHVLMALGPDFAEELDALRQEHPAVSVKTPEETEGLGEIVLLHLSGEAPFKVDRFWTAQAGSEIIRIAYPVFIPKPYRIRGARMRVGDQTSETEVAENVTAIAMQNLNDHIGRIKAKAIARQVTKYLAAKGMQVGGSKLAQSKKAAAKGAGAALAVAGTLWTWGSAIAEEADKRSWITLPAAVNVGRIYAPPGEVTLELEFLSHGGGVMDKVQIPVKVQAGRPTLVSYRTFE